MPYKFAITKSVCATPGQCGGKDIMDALVESVLDWLGKDPKIMAANFDSPQAVLQHISDKVVAIVGKQRELLVEGAAAAKDAPAPLSGDVVIVIDAGSSKTNIALFNLKVQVHDGAPEQTRFLELDEAASSSAPGTRFLELDEAASSSETWHPLSRIFNIVGRIGSTHAPFDKQSTAGDKQGLGFSAVDKQAADAFEAGKKICQRL